MKPYIEFAINAALVLVIIGVIISIVVHFDNARPEDNVTPSVIAQVQS